MKNIEVGIIGGAGYTAGELIRLLMHHPNTNINFVFSTSNAGNKISKIHQDLVGSLDKEFTNTVNPEVDVLFLCLGHGNSIKFLSNNTFSENTKIIDLGNDLRLEADKVFDGKHLFTVYQSYNVKLLKWRIISKTRVALLQLYN